jgi:hypothetical protein
MRHFRTPEFSGGVGIVFSSPKDLADRLLASNYVIDETLLPTIYLAARMHRPLLIEGPPGSVESGKAAFDCGNARCG